MGTSVSNILTVVTPPLGVAPGPATNLATSNITATSMTLSWTAPATGDTPFAYQPQIAVSGVGTYTNIGQPIAATTVAVSGLIAGTTYLFIVSTTNASGSSVSSAVSQTTLAAPPGAPSGLSLLGGVTTSSVGLQWNAPATGTPPFTYQVSYATPSGSGTFTPFTTATTALSQTITGLNAGVSYDFNVTASNAAGVGLASAVLSNVLTAGVSSNAPGPASGLAVSNLSTTTLTLSWTAPTTGSPPFTYQPQVSISGSGTFTNSGPTVLTATSAAITGLAANTAYQLQVLTTNGTNPSSISASVAATTLAILPGAPSGLTVVGSPTSSSIALSWVAPTTGSPPFTYQVLSRTPTGGGSFTPAGGTTTALTQTITGLIPGGSYDFVIQAINSAGTGPNSAALLNVMTAGVIPGPASALAASAITATSLTLTWTAPTTGTTPFTYQIQQASAGGTNFANVGGSLSATTGSVTGLTANTAYLFQILTTNTGGSSTSPSVAATTLSVLPSAPTSLVVRPIGDNGYIESLKWLNNTSQPITYFSVTYIVPPLPASNDGQILYLWGGIESSDAQFLLQPVLQWGGSGGPNWTLQTYWLSTNSSTGQPNPIQVAPATPIQVAPGTTIQGTVTCTAGTRGQNNFAYTAQFVGYPTTVFSISGNEELNFPIIALEAYSNGSPTIPLVSCSDYPNVDFTTMGSIVVQTGTPPGAGSPITPSWATTVNFADCGQGITGSGGSYNFYYHNSPSSPLTTAIALSWVAPTTGTAPFTYQVLSRTPTGSGPFAAAAGTTTAATQTITGLLPSHGYDFEVTAANGAGTGPASAILVNAQTAAGSLGSAPAPATALVASAITATTLTLSWTTPASGTTPFTYQPQDSVSGGAFANVGGTVSVTTAALTGLTAATVYQFQIVTTNSAGSSTSASIGATTLSVIPGAPSGLAVVGSPTTSSVVLSWAAPATGTPPFTYQVLSRTPTGSGGYTIIGATTSALTQTITGLAAGSSFDFEVEAINPAGTGAVSAALSNVVTAAGTTAPAPATALVASAITTTSLTLSWTVPATGTLPFTYQPQDSVSGGAFANIGGTVAVATVAITGLSAATVYQFQIVTTNSVGSSTSASISATTLSVIPGAPSGLAVVGSPTTNSIALSWVPGTGTAPFTYQVLSRTPTGTGTYAAAGAAVSTLTTTVSGLSAGVSYDFEVEAINGAGTGPPSAALVNVVTAGSVAPGAPSVPTNLAAGNASATTIPVTWSASATGTAPISYIVQWQNHVIIPGQITGLTAGGPTPTSVPLSWGAPTTGTLPFTYLVMQSLHSAGTYTQVATSATTSVTVSGLSASTAYDFEIVASNSAGNGAASAVATATTLAAGGPGPVSNITAGTITSGSITINWTAPTTGSAVSYQVGRGTSASGPFTTVGNPTATSFTASASASTTYYFQITPFGPGSGGTNIFGTPAVSAGFTSLDATPKAVTNILFGTITYNSIALQWTAPSGSDPVAYYGFSYATSPGGPFTTINRTLPPTSTSYTFASGTDGVVVASATTYYFQITAFDATNTAGPSVVSGGATTASNIATTDNGYTLYAYWNDPNVNPIVQFEATWTVPPAPTVTGGQAIFLWIGLVPPDSSYVMQPVLAWSQTNGWTVGSTFTGAAFTTQSSANVSVQPGTQLTAVVTCTGTSGGTYNYQCYFLGYAASVLNVTGLKKANLAYIALEVAGMQSCGNFPPGGAVFSNISTNVGTPNTVGTPIGPSWTPVTAFSDCGLGITVNSASQITMTF